MHAIYQEFYASHATPEELQSIFGHHWAICRKTPDNITRYNRCITPKEYDAAQRQALKARNQ